MGMAATAELCRSARHRAQRTPGDDHGRGRFRTIPEIVGMLNEAGFSKPRYVKVSDQDFSFVIGR